VTSPKLIQYRFSKVVFMTRQVVLFYLRQRRPWIGVVDPLVSKPTYVYTDWNTKKGKINHPRRKRQDTRLLFDGGV
jgi:hypothetical protein